MEILSIEGFSDEWDEFVWASSGGTIFHTLKFLSYHPVSRFDFVNFAIRDRGRLICVVPGAAVGKHTGRIFRSPAGASFGGFVFADDCDLKTMQDAVAAFGEKMRDMGFAGAEIALPPLCYSRNEHQGLSFVLTSLGYRPTLREATAVVPLDTFDQNGLQSVLARNLRKAAREGLLIRSGTDPADFYRILTANLSAKGVSPTHTLEEIETLFTLYPDKLVLLEAVMEDRVVGGSLVVLCNDRVGLSFYVCVNPEERKLRVTETVLFHSIRKLRESGYRYFDLGTVSRSGRPDWGLIRFKSKFATRTYVREHYRFDLEGNES
ncbi:MAG: GNAT family N-acetyltransferase [Candidatus Eisenbacteria bacterium]